MDTLVRLKAHIQPSGSTVFRQSLSVCLRAKKKEKATVILSPRDFKQTVDRVKALTVCHVFSVASSSRRRVCSPLERSLTARAQQVRGIWAADRTEKTVLFDDAVCC